MTRRQLGLALLEPTLVLVLLAGLTTLALSLAHGQQSNQRAAERAHDRVSAERVLSALGRYYWSHCQDFDGVYPTITVEELVAGNYLGSVPPTHNEQSFVLALSPTALSVTLPVAGDPVRLTAHPALLRGDPQSWRYRTLFEEVNCE